MEPLVDIEDYMQAIRALEGLKHKEIKVTSINGEEAINSYRGYDRATIDLENLASVRIAFSAPKLSEAAVFNSSGLAEQFDLDDLAALRQNVITEFGEEIWPKDEQLDFVRMMQIMDACNKALEEKRSKIVKGPKELRWEFEDASLDARIAAINECDLIAPYERLKNTLIKLADDSNITDAIVQLRSVSTFDEFKFADGEIEAMGKAVLDQEVAFSFNGSPEMH